MDEISRGIRAKELLEDGQLDEILARVEERFHKEWVRATDAVIREQVWAKTQALEEVRREIRARIANGEVAAAIADAESD